MLNPRSILRKVRQGNRLAQRVLEPLFMARDGSRWERALAIGSVGGTLLELAFPEQDVHEQLVARGYTLLDTVLGEFYCEQIRRSPFAGKRVGVDEEDAVVLGWKVGDTDAAVVLVYGKDRQLKAGPYILDGDLDHLRDLLQIVIWNDHPGLTLRSNQQSAQRKGRGRKGGASRSEFALSPLGPPETYIAEPGLDWYVQRLRAYESDHRTILLSGATGVGKDTLARAMAQELGPKSRVLRVANETLNAISLGDLLDLVQLLCPRVLLLDDLNLTETRAYREKSPSAHLSLFESLHEVVDLAIVTRMTEGQEARGENKGHDAFVGMRPGRIDEVFHLKIPSKRVGTALLLHFLGQQDAEGACKHLSINEEVWEDIIVRCKGLTGAYVAEVAKRLDRHGVATYKSEINAVRRQADMREKRAPKNDQGPATLRVATRRNIPRLSEVSTRNAIIAALNIDLPQGRYRVTSEPWSGILIIEVPRDDGEDKNRYGGVGEPMFIVNRGWKHGDKKGGPYKGKTAQEARDKLVKAVVKQLTKQEGG